jgi:Translin family
VLYCGWLGGFQANKKLLTLEDVGRILNVAVNSTEDQFHITIEEYLHALISLIEELVSVK